MKKKVIAIVCAVAVLAAAGGGVTWNFLGNGTKEDDNVVYVNTVKALTNLGTGNGMENRYAGVVESENTWKVEKTLPQRRCWRRPWRWASTRWRWDGWAATPCRGTAR